MSARIIHGDARQVLADMDLDRERTVIVTDPVWPNAPAGAFGVEDPWSLFEQAAAHFPRLARRVVVHLGCASDPRFLSAVSRELPFVRACWLRYNCPSYAGTVLNSGDMAYVFGSAEPPQRCRLLPGECTSSRPTGREVSWHPMPRKLEHAMWVIENFTRPDDMVVDPFCGSATYGLACQRLGRAFIGIEQHADFAARARHRLELDAAGSSDEAQERGQMPIPWSLGHLGQK